MNNWITKKIADIARTTSGGTPNRSNKSYYNGDILWVKSGELEDNFISDTEEKITEKAIKESSAKVFPINTVLMAMYGATVGKTAILKKAAATNQAICAIFPNEEIFHHEFIRFQLIHRREDFLKQRFGGAQPNINQQIIKNFELVFPPLLEQRKIAAILSTVQKAIETQTKLIECTTELKRAMMHKLFTEGIPRQARDGARYEKQKMTEIGLVPESWEVVKFEEMISFTSKPRELKVTFPVDFIPMELISEQDIYIRKTIKKEKVSSGTFAFNGDILLAKITPSFENGKQGIVSIDCDYLYSTTEVIPFKEKEKISDKLFLYYWLKKHDVRADLAGKMEGSTGRQRLIKAVLEKKKIPKPSLEEQKEISDTLLHIDNKIEHHIKKKQKFEELFRTLLQQLMIAEIRVNNIDLAFLEEN